MNRNSKGFTILELLVVTLLISLVFAISGTIFINNFKSISYFSLKLNSSTRELSFVNQISMQMFSKYDKRSENIKIDNDRISFYTGYPIFFEGFVRAEYILKKDQNSEFTHVYYEEFPYVDGNLGFEGLKRTYIGKFKNLQIQSFYYGRWFENYKGKNFPTIIKLRLDDRVYYITVNAKVYR